MGVCYVCRGCGQCVSWVKDFDNTCVRCGIKLEPTATVCPECGAPQPPLPGQISQ